ncbi:PREDICTED: F-box/kelch-repeat protein At4g25710-like, partial [Brassica oleracea var. oleracea]
CVARVSRLYYPTLSLVSKSFRSLVSSPELYKTRSLFGFTESCLYVCFTKDLWYTLCRKPDKTLKSGSSGYALARVPVPNSPLWHCRNMVAVGSNIYNIAFPRSLNVLPRVSILDCKSHSWIEAPSLPVELHSFSASVVDHKIYVAGFDHRLMKNSFEVFDTQTRVWDSLSTSNTSAEREEMFIKKAISIDGKFHVVTDKEVLAYDPKLAKWDMVGRGMRELMYSEAYCVIGNVLYYAKEGVFKWYDTERRTWRDLQGLVGLPKITRHREFIRLGDYGGKMVVFWVHVIWTYYKKIWCAEISLERRPDTSEIWGKVEWFDQLRKININFQVEKVLSTTL